MAIRMVPCRHITSGQTAEIPETALGHFSDWEPIHAQPEAAPEPEPASPSLPAVLPPAPEPSADAALPTRKKARAAENNEE